jgi:hypothetical protein
MPFLLAVSALAAASAAAAVRLARLPKMGDPGAEIVRVAADFLLAIGQQIASASDCNVVSYPCLVYLPFGRRAHGEAGSPISVASALTRALRLAGR